MRNLGAAIPMLIPLTLVLAFPQSALGSVGTSHNQLSSEAVGAVTFDLNPISSNTEEALIAWESAADAAGAVAEYRDGATGQMVVVMPGGASTAAAASVVSLASGAQIDARIVSARITKARLDAIRSALIALHSKSSTYGEIISFDPELQIIVVNTDAPAAIFAGVVDEYPTDVQIRPGGVTLQSRTSDTAPHWGGAAIRGLNSGQYGGCTSGFTAKDSSGHYLMVTAGHCFDPSTPIYNYKLVNGSWTGGGYYFGHVIAQDGDFDDEEFDASSYAGAIYTSDTAFQYVGDAGSFGVGADYCVSGAYGGKTCGHTDTSNSTIICEAFCFKVADLTGGSLTHDGDSGAPWYYPTTKVGIRGSHIGLGPNCPTQCNHMYATPWTSLSGAYPGGLSIVTG
jgi:hypothetical protein